MIKIIHIFSDRKFINEVNILFDNEKLYDNQIVVFGNSTNYIFNDMAKALFIEYSADNVDKLSKICDTYDIIVVYNIDNWKYKLIKKIDNNKVILWRFFGAELYSYDKHKVLSKKTKNVIKFYTLINVLKIMYNKIYRYMSLYRLQKKIRYFIGVSEMEYKLLNNKWFFLPKYLQYPISKEFNNNIEYDKSNCIIIGNSKSIFNNHCDIIDIIKSCDVCDKHKYNILFSYGDDNKYTQYIKKSIVDADNIYFTEQYMAYEEFIELYKKAIAFVHNGYRQMALGNIFVALNHHVKVYMNKKNVIYKWLLEEGFLVHDIESFECDLKNNNIIYSPEEGRYNRNAYLSLVKKHSIDNFNKEIKNIQKTTGCRKSINNEV